MEGNISTTIAYKVKNYQIDHSSGLTNTIEESSKKKNIIVPTKLPIMLEQIAKAVLIVQPIDVYAFTVYFLETYLQKLNSDSSDLPEFSTKDYKDLVIYKNKTALDLSFDQKTKFSEMFTPSPITLTTYEKQNLERDNFTVTYTSPPFCEPFNPSAFNQYSKQTVIEQEDRKSLMAEPSNICDIAISEDYLESNDKARDNDLRYEISGYTQEEEESYVCPKSPWTEPSNVFSRSPSDIRRLFTSATCGDNGLREDAFSASFTKEEKDDDTIEGISDIEISADRGKSFQPNDYSNKVAGSKQSAVTSHVMYTLMNETDNSSQPHQIREDSSHYSDATSKTGAPEEYVEGEIDLLAGNDITRGEVQWFGNITPTKKRDEMIQETSSLDLFHKDASDNYYHELETPSSLTQPMAINDPNLAATLIQAMYKGYKTRKELFANEKSPIHSPLSGKGSPSKRSPSKDSHNSMDETTAAVKIQSIVKGYLTRKELKEFLSALPSQDHRFNNLKKEFFSDDQEEGKDKVDLKKELPEIATKNRGGYKSFTRANIKSTGCTEDKKLGSDNLLTNISRRRSDGCGFGSENYNSSSYKIQSSKTGNSDDPGDKNHSKLPKHTVEEGSSSHPIAEYSDYLDSAASVIQSAFKSFIHCKKHGNNIDLYSKTDMSGDGEQLDII